MTQVGYHTRPFWPVYHPRTYFTSSYSGNLGFAFPTALGAKVARPDRAVVSLSGDGGFLFNAQELATAAQHGINVVAVVFNDQAYGNVARDLDEDWGGKFASELHNPDFVRLAESFGVTGWRATTPDELGGLVRRGARPRPPGADRDGGGTHAPPGVLRPATPAAALRPLMDLRPTPADVDFRAADPAVAGSPRAAARSGDRGGASRVAPAALRGRLRRDGLAARVRRPRRDPDAAGDRRGRAGPDQRPAGAQPARHLDLRADDHRPRHRGPEAALPGEEPHRRGAVVPALLGAERGLRPAPACAPGPRTAATTSR